MSNDKNPNKKKLQVWISAETLARIDGLAAEKGITRAGVVSEALAQYLSGSRPASAEELDGLAEKVGKLVQSRSEAATRADLSALVSKLDAAEKSREAANQALLLAIQNQPVVVQEAPRPELPPEPPSAMGDPEVRKAREEWKSKPLWRRIMKR